MPGPGGSRNQHHLQSLHQTWPKQNIMRTIHQIVEKHKTNDTNAQSSLKQN
jgi:hypothetical protein